LIQLLNTFAYQVVYVQVEVFWVVTVGYQRFGGPCCFHLHFMLKTEAAWTS